MEDTQATEQEMTTQPIENIVEIDEGRMFTTSLIVAEAFEKEHKNVLRDIENLECSKEFHRLNFEHTPYVHPQNGQTYPAYRLTRDGFAFLAMGFTGKKAAAWKEKFLEAFNAMEAALRRPALPFSRPPKEEGEAGQKRIIKLLRGFIAYWSFVEKIPLPLAEFIVCSRFRVCHLEEITLLEQQNEAVNYVFFMMNHPTHEKKENTSEQFVLLRHMLTACSQFGHTRDWDLEADFENLSGIPVNDVALLSAHDTEKMLSLAGRLLHRVFQRTEDWNYLLDVMEKAE